MNTQAPGDADVTEDSRAPNPPTNGASEALAVAVLVVITALWAYLVADLTQFDESLYLSNGLDFLDARPPISWGPTYSDLYFVLSRVVLDPVNLYFAGQAMSASLFVLGVWLSVRIVSAPWIAWVAGLVAACMPATFTWPGVSGPASGAVLVAVALVFRSAGWPASVGAILLMWFAAGSRPELAWVALVVSLLLFGDAVHRHRRTDGSRKLNGVLAVVLASVVAPVALALVHGNWFSSASRSWAALADHYTGRFGADLNNDVASVIERDFPGVSSIPEAFLLNPGAITQHVSANLIELPGQFLGAIISIPHGITPLLLRSTPLLLLFAVATVGVVRRRRYGAGTAPVRVPIRVLAAVVAGLAIPPLLIYPRVHYLVALSGMVVAGLAIVVYRSATPRMASTLFNASVLVALGLVAVALLTLPNRITNPPARATAAQLLGNSGSNYSLLAAEHSLAVYVPSMRIVTDTPRDGESFEEFINRTSVTVIDLAISYAPVWLSLPGYSEFAADPGLLGFHEVFPDSGIWRRD